MYMCMWSWFVLMALFVCWLMLQVWPGCAAAPAPLYDRLPSRICSELSSLMTSTTSRDRTGTPASLRYGPVGRVGSDICVVVACGLKESGLKFNHGHL